MTRALFILFLTGASMSYADTWHDGDLTTYSPGSWGGDPTVDAGATLLEASFATVYASTFGVTVGSFSGYTMSFTDADSVLRYMAPIGTYAPLNGNTLDPITTASGAFGGAVLALQLNVDFSDAGLLPGTSGLRFGDLILENFSTLPALDGLTVRQFLGDVNVLLGGGSTTFTIADMANTLALQDLEDSFSNGYASDFAEAHLVAPGSTSTGTVPESSSWILPAAAVFGMGWTRRMRARRGRGTLPQAASSKRF